MENETVRSRVVSLLQRSRQAHRLYSSMERGQRGEGAEFSELQAAEWRSVNSELMKELASLIESPNPRTLGPAICLLRDRFTEDFRTCEAELRQKQKELLVSAEKSDFIKCAVASRALVTLKARVQATQAVHHELDTIVTQSRLAPTSAPLAAEVSTANISELDFSASFADGDAEPQRLAKVIPLRARR